MDHREGNMSILMLPWLAHGHISPFLELAKKLSLRKFIIYLCSTPINLSSIKKSIIDSASIKLVQLHLPSLPDLPPNYHTTNGLPHNLMHTLKHAFDLSTPAFTNILTTVKPDLLLYDFNQPWAASIASSLNIPAVQFLTGAVCFNVFALHMLYKPGENFPYPLLWPHGHRIDEPIDSTQIPQNDNKDIARFLGALQGSRDIILCKTFREIEGKYIDYFSLLSNKKIVTVGPLVQDSLVKEDADDDQHKQIIEWLDKKEENSVVFVSFGSEYFLSKEEMEEVANGLELSEVNFIWVVRFPAGERIVLKEALPQDFIERVGERGMVVEGWAPQAKILGHRSTGGFVSHCGWSSVMEGMRFGVPIIAMPMHLDQPINARLVGEVGVGVEVTRDKIGKVEREKVAAVIKEVVAEKSGEGVRKKARDLSEKIWMKGEEEIDKVVEELVQLCGKNK